MRFMETNLYTKMKPSEFEGLNFTISDLLSGMYSCKMSANDRFFNGWYSYFDKSPS